MIDKAEKYYPTVKPLADAIQLSVFTASGPK